MSKAKKTATLPKPKPIVISEQESCRLEREERARLRIVHDMDQTIATYRPVCKNFSGCGGEAYALCKSSGICPMPLPGDNDDWQFLPRQREHYLRRCKVQANAMRRRFSGKKGPRLPRHLK